LTEVEPSSQIQAHRAFRAVLTALAMPGRPQPSTAADGAAAVGLLMAAVWADAPSQVYVVDGPDAAAEIVRAPRGTEAEPEGGATILRMVAARAATVRVRLEGPGVDGSLETDLPLSRAELRARGEACAAYPTGVDLVLVHADGVLTGLPRSTRVQEV